MLGLGALTFAAPWALAVLAVLPLIWWLLRVRPPAPRRIAFPAVRLLFGLGEDDQTPARTPPWLLILRLALAALVILGAAHPVMDIPAAGRTSGPLVLVVDDGWAAAAGWERRVALAEALIEGAALESRSVRIAGTAPAAVGADGHPRFPIGAPASARDALAAFQLARPKPWPVDRAGFAEAFRAAAADMDDAEIAWMSDGVADPDPAVTARFMAALEEAGPVAAWLDPTEGRALALLPPAADAGGLALRAARAAPGAPRTIVVRASAADGRVLASQPLTFAEGDARAEGLLDVPLELRNEIARLAIEGETSAAAALFLDERYRRRPTGLISGGGFESSQPLLSDLYYLERALAPYSETHRGTLEELIGGGMSLLVLADVGRLTAEAESALAEWIESGGVLVRFAGARVAEGVDGLVPVRLRGGGRALGGALTWERPRGLGPFPDASPFAGLAVPGDVAVERQVLAEPAPDLDAKSWARLDDGTPLVTAARRGAGWLVLFHTTANAEWSSLALSGLFVDMMRRIAGLSEGVAGADAGGLLPPLVSLDGFGRPGDPPPGAAPIAAADFAAARPGPAHPPGEYGDAMQRRALNLGSDDLAVAAIAELPGTAARRGYAAARARDLRPWLLAAALALGIADTLIALRLRGRLPAPFRRRAGALAAPLALALPLAALPGDAAGQALADAEIAALTQQTRFAWVETGDPAIDRTSAEGLTGLSWVLRARTAVEAGEPVGVDPARDELAFYPLLYWPVAAAQAPLDAAALGRINDYLRRGGLIVFDTRDRSPGAQAAPGGARLRALLRGLNIPPLRRVPRDHALTRSFYLLDRFPGRWTGGDIWVESYEGGVNDGVSSIVVGSNDYAAAWALDADGFPLYPTIPGTDRQREWAMRFGVNLAMYALTGNYKADQVHIPAILRRLGESGAAE